MGWHRHVIYTCTCMCIYICIPRNPACWRHYVDRQCCSCHCWEEEEEEEEEEEGMEEASSWGWQLGHAYQTPPEKL